MFREWHMTREILMCCLAVFLNMSYGTEYVPTNSMNAVQSMHTLM